MGKFVCIAIEVFTQGQLLPIWGGAVIDLKVINHLIKAKFKFKKSFKKMHYAQFFH